MGVYVYATKKKTVRLTTGEFVGLCSYAYKDCYYGFSKRVEGQIARKMLWAKKAAEALNGEGVKMLAMGDKFVEGLHVYKYEQLSAGYYDTDFNGELAGELEKQGQFWAVVPVKRITEESLRKFEANL